MAGETDKEDYSDLKLEPEYEWQQNQEIAELKGANYRYKVVDEEKKKRRELNSKKTEDLYGNFLNKDVVHGFNEQDALLLQQLVEGEDDIIKNEHKQVQNKLQILEQQRTKL